MRPESAKKLLPLLDREVLEPADVFVLCQSSFWLRRCLSHDEVYAKRQALLVGFHALAGLKCPTLATIDLNCCFPDEFLIRVKLCGKLKDVAITSTVAKLLRDWILVRPPSASKKLFATADGPIPSGSLENALRTMGKTFGIARFPTALVRFFKANLQGENATKGDLEVVRAYLNRRMSDVVTTSAIRRLLTRTDPFKEAARCFGDSTMQGSRDFFADSNLPSTYDDCLAEKSFPSTGPRIQKSYSNHPLSVELAAFPWPGNHKDDADARASLYLKHRTKILELTDEGTVPVAQFAKLFRMTHGSFNRLSRKHRGNMARRGGTTPAVAKFADPTCLAFESVRKLMRVKWSNNRGQRLAVREPLFATFGCEIERLVAEGRLLMKEAAALFGYSGQGFRERLARARTEDRGDSDGHLRRYALRERSAGETARLDEIARAVWPEGERRAGFARTMLLKHAAFVCELVGARKLRVAEAASILGISKCRFTLLRAEYRGGTLELAIAGDGSEDRAVWRELVLREMPNRPSGQGNWAFYIDLRKRYGMPLSIGFVQNVVSSAARKPATAKYVAPAPPARTTDEQTRVAAIASTKWKEGEKDDQRRALLKEHFGFIFAMIDARKVTMAEAARLFRVRADLMTQFRSDFRAGCFDWALSPPVAPEERQKWLDLIRREWPKRPKGQKPNEFCRFLRRRFGFPLPFTSINHALVRMRLHDPHEPSLYSKAGRVKPLFTTADEVLLRHLRKVKWPTGAEVAELRRALLAEHFPAVAAMLATWKLNTAQAGKLFYLGTSAMWRLHREYREGTFDLAIAPPPSPKQRAEWSAVVLAEIAAQGGHVENVADFWRRLRREKRLSLSLDTVRTLVRSTGDSKRTYRREPPKESAPMGQLHVI